MIQLTRIEKAELVDKLGVLQPPVKDLDTDGISLDTYSNKLQSILEDEDTSEELKDKLREVLVGDIVDPLNSIQFLISLGMYNETTAKGDLVEDYRVNDEELGITTVDLKAKGELSGKQAVESARASLGIRESKKITLFRSGFWIAIGDISNADIIELERNISDVSIELREAMVGLEFTADIGIYTGVIMDFVEKHIIASSLDVPVYEIRKYITIFDIEMLYGGVIDAINPRGFNNFFRCSNTLSVEEADGEEGSIEHASKMALKCNETFEAKLRCKELLRVAPNKLSSEQRLQLLKGKNTLSKEDIFTYTAAFDNEITTSIEDEEISFSITFKDANVRDSILVTEYWNGNIATALDKLSIGEDEKAKVSSYREYYTKQALAVYTPFIETLTLNNGSTIKDMLSIIDVLAEISENEVLATELSKTITKYIDKNIIAIYGVPEFICSKCNTVHTEDGEEGKEEFTGIIPINMRKYFFTLLTLRG